MLGCLVGCMQFFFFFSCYIDQLLGFKVNVIMRALLTYLPDAAIPSTFSYAQYSVIAARALRQALKEPLRVEAVKRDGSQIKIIKWKDGKAISK